MDLLDAAKKCLKHAEWQVARIPAHGKIEAQAQLYDDVVWDRWEDGTFTWVRWGDLVFLGEAYTYTYPAEYGEGTAPDGLTWVSTKRKEA